MKYILYLWSFLFLSTSFGFDSRYHIKNFTVKDGLPSSQIYNITQDIDGYYWFASDRGLIKSDGKKFKILDDFQSAVFIRVKACPTGGVWAYNLNGTLVRITRDGKITTKRIIDQTSNVWRQVGLIRELYVTTKGEVIIDAEYKTIRYKPNGEIIELSKTYERGGIITFMEYHSQMVRFSINKVEENSCEVLCKKISGKELIRKVVRRKSKYIPGSGRLTNDLSYYYGNHEVYDLTQSDTIAPIYSDPRSRIQHCISLDKDRLLVGSRSNGLFILHRKTGQIERLIDGVSVVYLFVDNRGQIWGSTLWNGVFSIALEEKELKVENDKIRMISSYENDVFVSFISGKVGKVGNQSIDSVYFDPKNVLPRVFAVGKEAAVIASGNSFFLKKGEEPLKLKTPYITKLSLLNDSIIAFLCNTKLIVFNKNKETYFRKQYLSYIENVFLDGEKVLLSTRNGLWVDSYMCEDTEPQQYFSQLRILTAFRIKERYVLATRGRGVLMLDSNYRIINKVDKFSGLFSDQVTKMEYHSGILWVSCQKGVQCFKITNNGFKLITSLSNLHSGDELIDFEVLTKDLVLATDQGLRRIKIADIFRISEIRDRGDFVELKTCYRGEDGKMVKSSASEFAHNQNSLEFKWGIIVSPFSSETTFRYRIVNNKAISNAKWHNTTRNEVDFEDLSSGKYAFELEHLQSNGKWNPLVKKQFTILLPWWNRGWFYVVIMTLMVFFFLFVFKIYFKSVIKQKEIDYEIQSLKNKALRSQMNPHFIFNALNSVQRYISEEDSDNASIYLTKFANMVRKILENSDTNFLPLKEELNLVEQYLEIEKTRFKERLDYHIDVDKEIVTETIIIPSFTIQPIVENAIKHGVEKSENKEYIEISIFKDDDLLKIKVLNSGSELEGVVSDLISKRNSFGLRGVHNRLKALNDRGGVEIGSKRKNETEIIIKLPLTV